MAKNFNLFFKRMFCFLWRDFDAIHLSVESVLRIPRRALLIISPVVKARYTVTRLFIFFLVHLKKHPANLCFFCMFSTTKWSTVSVRVKYLVLIRIHELASRLDFRRSLISGVRSPRERSAGFFPEQRLVYRAYPWDRLHRTKNVAWPSLSQKNENLSSNTFSYFADT